MSCVHLPMNTKATMKLPMTGNRPNFLKKKVAGSLFKVAKNFAKLSEHYQCTDIVRLAPEYIAEVEWSTQERASRTSTQNSKIDTRTCAEHV